jgi:histidine ammonia-lyase
LTFQVAIRTALDGTVATCRTRTCLSSSSTAARLTIDGVVAVARGRAQARLTAQARERNLAALRLVRDLLDRGELLYGTSTGVGSLRSAPSQLEDAGDHQWRLVRSHAGGGGAPLSVEVVRAAMAVRANQIGAGGAGVGEPLLDGLLDALAPA